MWSNPFSAQQDVIELPDDDEEASQKTSGRKTKTSGRRAPASKALQTAPAPESELPRSGDLNQASVTFADPVSSVHPSGSTVQAPASSIRLHASEPQVTTSAPSAPLFTTHRVPEDQVNAAKEAIRQAGLMMEQMKVVREASQAAYDASSALQTNVQVSRLSFSLIAVLLGYDV